MIKEYILERDDEIQSVLPKLVRERSVSGDDLKLVLLNKEKIEIYLYNLGLELVVDDKLHEIAYAQEISYGTSKHLKTESNFQRNASVLLLVIRMLASQKEVLGKKTIFIDENEAKKHFLYYTVLDAKDSVEVKNNKFKGALNSLEKNELISASIERIDGSVEREVMPIFLSKYSKNSAEKLLEELTEILKKKEEEENE